MKTCLFGGSFDPIHSGHLTIARAAVRQACLDRVVFLPAACSPFKPDGNFMFTPEARIRMLQAATADLPWAEVSDLDLRMPPPSWSWRLVEAWKQAHPDDSLFWLMGSDQWDLLHKWGRYDYLIRHLTFIVFHRQTPPHPREGVRSLFIPGDHPASSSFIREALKLGDPIPPGWLPTGLAEIIAGTSPSRKTPGA